MIKVEFVLPEYSDGVQIDATPWFEQAMVEELLALDAHGWATDFDKPVPIPLLDILLYFKNRPGTGHVGTLLREICPEYGKFREAGRQAALIRVDSYAALAWLHDRRPVLMMRFEALRMSRAD